MKLRRLSLTEAEFIAHRLAVEMMNSSTEPIPPFNTANMDKLDSSLSAPFQTFNGRPLYRTLVERAAVLFYLITKNHCFSNGNKRMAVTLTVVLCLLNRKLLDIPPLELYRVANSVAESNPRDRDRVQEVLIDLFKKCMKPLPSEYIIDRRHFPYSKAS